MLLPRNWKDFKNFERMERQAEGLVAFEKIRKGKRSVRGRTVDDWLLDGPGISEEQARVREEELVAKGHLLGRVVEVHKRGAFVAEEPSFKNPDTGLVWFCSIAKRHFQRAHRERNFVVVGDRVIFDPDNAADSQSSAGPTGPASGGVESDLPRGVIQHAYRRSSRIARKDPLNPEWEHVMLANIDQVAIVASVLHPTIRWGLIDRFLVQAELERLPALIIVNKVDLLKDPDLASPEFVQAYKERIACYRAIGYDVVEMSALHPKRDPKGLAALRAKFTGKITGLCGHSGVGKSSVVNLMKPEFEQVVDEDADIFYKGRHTTTYNSLLRLGVGGYAIDTPGVRSFAIENFDHLALSDAFPEFRRYRCRYRECRHYLEVECGVRDALSRGEIAPERYRSYIGLLIGVSAREGELGGEFAELKADLEARRQASEELAVQLDGDSVDPLQSQVGGVAVGDAGNGDDGDDEHVAEDDGGDHFERQ
jgi:ribosome biogenesis GTPase